MLFAVWTETKSVNLGAGDVVLANIFFIAKVSL
jgi:hypothetical protein